MRIPIEENPLENKGYDLPKIKPIWVVFIVVLVASIWLFYNQHLTNKMDKVSANRKFTIGTVVSVDHQFRGSKDVFYSYYVNGKNYISSINIERFSRDSYVNKQFQVIYDSLEPSNSSMLIFVDNFNYFNIPMPDSLSIYNR
jgi:hypothetical protein